MQSVWEHPLSLQHEPDPNLIPRGQVLQGLSAGSAFDVTVTTESTLLGRQSSVHGQSLSRVVEAVPPLLSQVRLRPPDATTTELLLEYEVLETAGQMYYALSEASAITEGGKVIQWPAKALDITDGASFHDCTPFYTRKRSIQVIS